MCNYKKHKQTEIWEMLFSWNIGKSPKDADGAAT